MQFPSAFDFDMDVSPPLFEDSLNTDSFEAVYGLVSPSTSQGSLLLTYDYSQETKKDSFSSAKENLIFLPSDFEKELFPQDKEA